MNITLEQKIENYTPIIKRVARRVASEHHIIEREDMEQFLYCFVIKRKDSLPDDPKEVDWSVQSRFLQVARTEAFNQKRQHYMIDAAVSYSVKDVKRILLTHFDANDWDVVSTDGESVEDSISEHSDVAWALDHLDPKERSFVAECYKSNEFPASGTKEYRKLNSLTIKIANIANHFTRTDEGEGVGRRKAMSNAQSRAMIDSGTI